jgi:hypothetical protein
MLRASSRADSLYLSWLNAKSIFKGIEILMKKYPPTTYSIY